LFDRISIYDPDRARNHAVGFLCCKNEWAPVHESIAGPDIFVMGEGFLVDTSIYLRIQQRVAFALQSRGYVRIAEGAMRPAAAYDLDRTLILR
jgi:hypothetical protein